MRIEKHAHGNELMRLIAPLVLQKNVFKELGYPVYSDDLHTWFVAICGNSAVGCCAAIDKFTHYQCSHDFVHVQWRGRGIYRQLFDARCAFIGQNDAKATCTAMSIGMYHKRGFKIIKATKNYTFVSRDVL